MPVGNERRNNVHTHKLQNLIVTVHEAHLRELSCDCDANYREDYHLPQCQRGNRAFGERPSRPQAKRSEGATEANQAERDARPTDEVGCVENKGQWRLPVRRYGPKSGLKVR